MAALEERALLERVLRHGSRELVAVHPGASGLKAVATRDLGKHMMVRSSACTSGRARKTGSSNSWRMVKKATSARITNSFAASHGHLSGAAMFPPEARRAMDRVTGLAASQYIGNLDAVALDKFFALHDAFRTAGVGERVSVDGLESEAGRALNGCRGVVVGENRYTGRKNVRVTLRGGQEVKRSIRPQNFKGAGGIVRTNAFADSDDPASAAPTGKLLETLCRLNHACGDAANVTKMFDDRAGDGVRRAYVMTPRPVNRGEELLIDYIPGETANLDTQGRRDYLKTKCNFDCECAKCGPLSVRPQTTS